MNTLYVNNAQIDCLAFHWLLCAPSWLLYDLSCTSLVAV